MRHETSDQRARRLLRQREYNRRRRTANSASEIDEASAGTLETEEHREIRLARQREYHARRQRPVPDTSANQNSSVWDDLYRDVTEFKLSPADADCVSRIRTQLRSALGANGLDECVCAVCDRLTLRKVSQTFIVDEMDFLSRMRRVLGPPSGDLNINLREQYECADLHPALAGMMLSRNGIVVSPIGTRVCICNECHKYIRKHCDKPPKFAIANGFFIGQLPEDLFEATWIEKVMIQLVTVVAQTRVMRGGQHRAIRSHCLVFDATPGPPATILPRRIDRDGPYRVVLAGPMTPEQTDRIRKLHQARGHIVRKLLHYLTVNNDLYKDVRVDDDLVNSLDADTSIHERIFIDPDDSLSSENVDNDQHSVSSRPHVTVDNEEDECNIIEQSTLMAEEGIVGNASFAQRVVDLNEHEPTDIPRLRVDHSSQFAGAIDIEAKMHAHLFPFGRGHPGELRANHVSKIDCIRYYAMLSSRRFAQDPTFLLAAFARLSIEKMYTLTSVKCRRYNSLFEGYEDLSREDIAAALINNERRQRGEPCQQTVNANAERFFKSVELGSVSVWGSSAERRQCRQEAFAYQTRYGQPTLFVTLSPNSDNSYAMAHYCGISSVDTLFDCLEARIPSRVRMKQASMMDDSSSARLFMRTVSAFIEHVLGVDPVSKQSKQDGLFGRTKAYYGMVETQGRGSLHIHFLIWLEGAPVNSDVFDDNVRLHGDSFFKKMEEYVDSVVTTELPLSVQGVKCYYCRSPGVLKALPILSSSRRENKKHHSVDVVEPMLLKCANCEQSSCSQYMIREALLQNRPPHWPPPLAPMTRDDWAERLEIEAIARLSTAHGTCVLEDREMFHASIRPTESDKLAEWIVRIHNVPQNIFPYDSEDVFKTDAMNRMIEMMPPSLDFDRMSSAHQDYMLSCLVVNFNMHSWVHTPSCFKRSRATSTASLCRYGFPRERATSTSITGPSVTVKRDLGHEYINGYNPTIMLMFKCNHDIQVLFGGKSAINRIYYICKYVTKTQRQVDSVTAVALASFQRRQAKEAIASQSDAPPSLSDIQRRRVTSMVYTFTNKQEIAGPLAALYIFRESCRYSSSECVRLPLSDILKQLEGTGDYECSLVQAGASHTFSSASYLDDYIYRPQMMSSLNLYEFTMICYRRSTIVNIPDRQAFLETHPLSASHYLAYRRKASVPIIKGPRLQSICERMTASEKEVHAKVALVLFKPFRAINDLVRDNEDNTHAWTKAYLQWESYRSQFTRMIMCNMNDYHVARSSENESGASDGNNVDEYQLDSESDVDSCNDGCDSDELNDLEFDDDPSLLSTIFDVHVDGEDHQQQEFPSRPELPNNIQGVINKIRDHQLVNQIALDVATIHRTNITEGDMGIMDVDDLRTWVENSSTDSCEVQQGMNSTGVHIPKARVTQVSEIIDNALQPDQLIWEPCTASSKAPAEIPTFSGIATISKLFTLNELQHGAFCIAACHMLRRWQSASSVNTDLSISDDDLYSRQLRMFLGGEGGTGKSRVIQALQALCRSWERPNAIVIAAMTGKAATLVGGRTLASFVLSLKNPNSHVHLQDVDCLIIDEVSMMAKSVILELDRLLKNAKRISQVIFGGIHIILAGDFLQLPPVAADPLYYDPTSKDNATSEDIEGFLLWRKIDKIVILRESVRFRLDPEWGVGCSKARYGEWTKSFVEMINARTIDNTRSVNHPERSLPSGSIFVTPDNDTRTAINGLFISCAGTFLSTHQLPVRVVADFKGALNNISHDDLCHIMGLPDSKFGRMAPYLDLLRGMPIQITQNIRTNKGVANGTTGNLHRVEFPPGTTFRRVLDRRMGTMVLLPNKRPVYALVRLQRGHGSKPIADGLDPEFFPVFPDAQAYSVAKIELTSSTPGEPRVISLRIRQFPFVCAVAATIYKVQGESLQSMVVVDWKGKHGSSKPQQAYLMVSRVVRREALVCLKPMTPAISAWAKPPLSAVNEDTRLANESLRTLSEFYNSR